MRTPRRHEKGAMLFVALLFCLMISSLMVYLLNLAYQRTRLVDTVGIKRTRNYYRAQAGMVDAFWRIRVDRRLAGWASGFSDPTFTATYYLDTEGDAVSTTKTATSTVQVTVGAQNRTPGSALYGLRPVSVTAFDNG